MTSPSAPNLKPAASQMPVCPVTEIPLVKGTAETLEGYGCLVANPEACDVEIVQWPAQGWRSIEPGTGDEGGTTEGIFSCDWTGGELHMVNDAVGGDYIGGWSREPYTTEVETLTTAPPEHAFIWHANYHPDGGQLFFPLDRGPFVAPLALPGDDAQPDSFTAFWFDGTQGLYIHPGVWHEGVFPANPHQRFFDKQGKVHARVNLDFVKEFGCYLFFPLTPN